MSSLVSKRLARGRFLTSTAAFSIVAATDVPVILRPVEADAFGFITILLQLVPSLVHLLSRGAAAHGVSLKTGKPIDVVGRALIAHAMNVAGSVSIASTPSTQLKVPLATRAPMLTDFLTLANDIVKSGTSPTAVVNNLLNALHVAARSVPDFNALLQGAATPINVTTALMNPTGESQTLGTEGKKETKVVIFAVRRDSDEFQKVIYPTLDSRNKFVQSLGQWTPNDPTTVPTVYTLVVKAMGAVQSVLRKGLAPPPLLAEFLDLSYIVAPSLSSNVVVMDSAETPIKAMLAKLLDVSELDEHAAPELTGDAQVHISEALRVSRQGANAYRALNRGHFALIYSATANMPPIVEPSRAATATTLYVYAIRGDSSYTNGLPSVKNA